MDASTQNVAGKKVTKKGGKQKQDSRDQLASLKQRFITVEKATVENIAVVDDVISRVIQLEASDGANIANRVQQLQEKSDSFRYQTLTTLNTITDNMQKAIDNLQLVFDESLSEVKTKLESMENRIGGLEANVALCKIAVSNGSSTGKEKKSSPIIKPSTSWGVANNDQEKKLFFLAIYVHERLKRSNGDLLHRRLRGMPLPKVKRHDSRGKEKINSLISSRLQLLG